MALFDRASLVQIPSGYKEGKLYNIKPFNQPFEFERGSAATRVNEDGLIETLHDEATNLLLQSNQFDTTWANIGSDETSGQSGYDGSNNAWILEATTSGSSKYIKQEDIVTSGVVTFSCYAKAGTTDFLRLQINGTTTAFGIFDLNNGVLGSTLNEISTNIESVGNGWYRCSLTRQDSSIPQVRIYLASSISSIAVTQGDNIYIQDAQLESGYFATPHIETTTETVTQVNKHDTPRLDYSGTEPSLLLEPQRTNIVEDSWDTNTWTWGKDANPNNTTRSFGYSAPDGSNNATLFTRNAGTTGWFSWGNITTNVSADFTYSIFVKKGTSNTIELKNVSASPQSRVVYDFDTDSFTTESNATGKSVAYGNGWYRISMTYANGTAASSQIRHTLEDGESAYVFGSQAEQGSYATSYIPTNGQTETRLADVCNGGGDASVFNDSEGTIYYEVAALGDDSTHRFIALSDGTNSNRISLGFKNGSSAVEIISSTGGGFSVYINTTYSIADTYKIALKYSTNNVKLWVNGSQSGSSTTYSAISSLDTLNFDSGGGSSNLYANVKSLHYFPTALTDTELQELTTI